MGLPSDKGTYILILHLIEPAVLTIGKLGVFDFPSGWYAYVGSAFNSGGLRGRLKHHFAPVTKPHWHIDYLRAAAIVCEVWYRVSKTVYEHQWADMLRVVPGAAIPCPRFGASDCTCETHLIYFAHKPEMAALCRYVGVLLQWH
ncbi:MAG: GIY-YIG nuclease family protein [Anaerolineae bacterium]|nr:GIY-YIG nuclease family protein [Anaerolineae bacterium]